MIDLRSDTVTRPTPAMRAAMAAAEVGDDVYGEDPTVNRLEATAAARLGKEAALFVPTGTMGNLVAITAHTRPGDEVIIEERGHSLRYELAGMAALAGVQPRAILAARGILTPALVEPVLQTGAGAWTRTGLVIIEQSHNLAGGTVYTRDEMRAMAVLARSHGVPLHVDGARLFNAAVALGVEASVLAAEADSVMFCLSKGLAAPVGSMLAGSADFVRAARRVRKRLGGGMRQAGILAAAGLVALETMVGRLAEDHDHARRLAAGIAVLPWVVLDPASVETNIVIFTLRAPAPPVAELIESLRAQGVLAMALDTRTVRLVTHYEVSAADVDTVVAAMASVV